MFNFFYASSALQGVFVLISKKMKELLLSPVKKTVVITSMGFLGGMTKT